LRTTATTHLRSTTAGHWTNTSFTALFAAFVVGIQLFENIFGCQRDFN
jgi:hypothetical protein